jgi:hypothetical protein
MAEDAERERPAAEAAVSFDGESECADAAGRLDELARVMDDRFLLTENQTERLRQTVGDLRSLFSGLSLPEHRRLARLRGVRLDQGDDAKH